MLAYCCKNGDPVLMLEPKQGERSDLRGKIDEHETIRDLMDAEPAVYCRYR